MRALDTLRAQHISQGKCGCCWNQVDRDHPNNSRTLCSCGQHEPCDTARLIDDALAEVKKLREGDWATLSRNLHNAETERDRLRTAVAQVRTLANSDLMVSPHELRNALQEA